MMYGMLIEVSDCLRVVTTYMLAIPLFHFCELVVCYIFVFGKTLRVIDYQVNIIHVSDADRNRS